MTTIGPGTKVRCTHDGLWHNGAGEKIVGPPKDSVWTVVEVFHRVALLWEADYLILREWPEPRRWYIGHFVPINDGLETLRELAREAKNPDKPLLAPNRHKVRERT